MKIEKIINNNIISSIDTHGQEIILMGCGIGFGKRRGDLIDQTKAEKIFRADNEERGKLLKLFSNIPEEHIQISSNIIDYAKQHLDYALSDSLYLALTDHISMAIRRMKTGIQLENPLLEEIKKNYNREYEVGEFAVDMINQQLNLTLTYEEAGFIALHLVNAKIMEER